MNGYRGGGMVWPLILILLGAVFLLHNLNVLPWGVWDTLWRFWPIILILIGLEILVGWRSGGALQRTAVRAELGGARQGEVVLRPGVGRLILGGGAAAGALLEGSVGEGGGFRVWRDASSDGATATCRLRAELSNWFGVPWGGGDPSWELRLSEAVPLRLRVELGAGESRLDLSRLQLSELHVEVGVGQSALALPAAGRFRGRVRGGVGQTTVRIPRSLPVRLRLRTGIGAQTVPPEFTQRGDYWYAPGYDEASALADLDIEGGVGEIRVVAD